MSSSVHDVSPIDGQHKAKDINGQLEQIIGALGSHTKMLKSHVKTLENQDLILMEIVNRLQMLSKQQRALDLNVTAAQQSMRQMNQQVNLLSQRCSERESRIRVFREELNGVAPATAEEFLDTLECSGTPSRKTSEIDLPVLNLETLSGEE